jgi:hypothetical protein
MPKCYQKKGGQGGARPGSGRPRSPERQALDRALAVNAHLAEAGRDPVEFLVQAMTCEGLDIDARLAAAKNSSPYFRPKLAAKQISIDTVEPIQINLLHYCDDADLNDN